MEDEITTYEVEPETVSQDVADGQSVVDAIHADNQQIADDVVRRVSDTLAAQSEGVSSGTVSIADDQWSAMVEQMRYQNTFGIMSCICMMAVFGAVVAQMVVKGWRRG